MDYSSISNGKGTTRNSEFRLVYCPKCQELLTEFAHIPLYQCGRCHTVLQAKKFGSIPSGRLNHSASSSPVSLEENSSPLLSSTSEEYGHIPYLKCLNNQAKTDANHLERVGKTFGTGKIVKTPIFDHENQSSAMKRLGNEDHWSGKAALGNPESLHGSKDVMHSSDDTKHNEVGGHSIYKAGVEKTPLGEAHHTSEGNASSSGPYTSNYEKEKTASMDNMTNHHSALPQKGFAASKSSDGRKVVHSSSNQRSSDTSGKLHSVKGMKFEKNTSPENLSTSTDSAILACDRIQMLRELDELRDHLIRTHVQRRVHRRDHMRVSRQAHHLQQLESFKSSHGTCEHSPFLLQSSISSFKTRNRMAHVHRESQSPSMTLDHLHYMSRNHPQGRGSCNLNPSCSNETYCHLCLHPPRSMGTRYMQEKTICLEDAERHKLEASYQNCKVERGSAKCHCRPFMGASCFISCYNCLRVLQIPEDFQFLMRTHGKLRCGECFQVLQFSVREKTRVVPYFADSRFPTGESGNTGERSDIELPLHSLMGYISASEILYDN